MVLLRFSSNKDGAPAHMAGHNEWIQRGFDDDVFLMVGSIKPSVGGAVLAHGISIDDLRRRVAEDPFVAADVVTAEIIEIATARTDDRLKFLLD